MTLIARCLCGPRVSLSDAAPKRKTYSDPTGTSKISKAWRQDLDRRWLSLKRMIPDAISTRTHPTTMISHSVLTGQDPIRAFQAWFDEALRQVVLGVNGAWL